VESQGSARAEWVEVTTKRGIVTGKYTAA
jgi:hypothetical protein